MTNLPKPITVPLPETMIVDFQPHGVVTLGSLRLGEYNGYPCLHGTVTEGTVTNRLFQFASKVSAVGELRTVYGIRDRELNEGRAVRVAM